MFTYKFPEEEQTRYHEFERVKKVYRNLYYDTTNSFDFFRQLFFRWRGSCAKLLWRHVAVWMFFYTILSVTYRFVLFDKPRPKQMFELMCIYAERFGKLVPITILTAFYVAQVVKRWWDQYNLLPWPDSMAIFIVGLLQDQDERGRLMRRNIMRYVLLAYVITLRRVSFRYVKV